MTCVIKRTGLVLGNSLSCHLGHFKSTAGPLVDTVFIETTCKHYKLVSRLAVTRSGSSSAFRTAASAQPVDITGRTRRWHPTTPSVACSFAKARSFTIAEMPTSANCEEGLSNKEASLVHLFIAASLHLWEQLPGAPLKQSHCANAEGQSMPQKWLAYCFRTQSGLL